MAGRSATSGRVRTLLASLSLVLAASAWAETVDYGQVSDAELQALGQRWDDLSGDERRALLMEVHKRMVAAGKQPVLRIRAERRYGYRVAQPDGSVVRIERREGFVRYRELNPDKPFGVGFERRAGGVPMLPVPVEVGEADAEAADPAEQGPVPGASRTPVYQLPYREVQATEPRR